ncbi:MAG: DUF3592 domain-containing protein [Chloroflexi bacterium]|nr:DUF3592 domain-containing protein [Chloroflexota bacterium]
MTTDLISYFQQAILWMILFSLFMFGIIIYLRIASNAVKNWPSVPGKVTTSRVSYESSTDKTNATPFIAYTYDVDGKTYKEGSISPSILTVSDKINAEKVVARYPRGSVVTVCYNPKNPSQAVLEKNSQAQIGGMYGILIFGNLLIPIVVLLVKVVFKH